MPSKRGKCFAFASTRMRETSAHARLSNESGGKFEGVLRAHRMGTDHTARDSARFSIVAEEWPAVNRRLRQLLSR